MNMNSKRRPLSTGVTYGLLSALLFGLSTPLAKLLVGEIQPLALAGLLYLGSGLGLALIWFWKRCHLPQRVNAVSAREWPWLLGAIAFGGILSPILLLCGLSQTSGSTGSLLLNLESVFTALLAWIFFKENCDARVVSGMLAITSGGFLLSLSADSPGGIGWGCGLITLACLGWAIDNNLTRQISHAEPLQIALLKGLCAGAVNITIASSLAGKTPSMVSALAAMVVGFLGYGLSLVLFVLALRHLGTARTAAYFSTAPFAGALCAVVLLKEPITWNLAAAAIIMAVGIWLHLTENHEHQHIHDEMFHEHEHEHDEHHDHEHSPEDPPGEPHSHAHYHTRIAHSHPHYPDLHHRHEH